MSAENIEARVARVIADAGGLQVADVRQEATLAELGLDSLDESEILMEIEEEFDIEIQSWSGAMGLTVGGLCDLVRSLTGVVA